MYVCMYPYVIGILYDETVRILRVRLISVCVFCVGMLSPPSFFLFHLLLKSLYVFCQAVFVCA